jgi:hypothetical protein
MLYPVHLAMNGVRTLVVIGTDCTGSCKSNYYTIQTTTAPLSFRNYLVRAGEISQVIFKMIVLEEDHHT